ncbi:MAG: hypothetical protein HXY49_08405 [Ignavibacteriaceae bacterium]|nr:hypothetical protein [Ignavibacteriaceae bacterium]
MDNFFEILIYLIIIISFLSSFFKKKQAPVPSPDERKKYPPDAELKIPSQKQDDEYDILKELENLFNYDTKKAEPPTYTTSPKSEEGTTSGEGKKELQQSLGSNYSAFKGRVDIQNPEFTKKQFDAKMEERAQHFEEILKSRSKGRIISSELIKKIRNPYSLRDYILISEIISKPKAMRR